MNPKEFNVKSIFKIKQLIEIEILFQSNQCSSCTIEFNNNFIQKDLPTLDYIDISTELTRFVYKKTIDTFFHSISDKLSSPLETLKRRGIPIDKLLKIQQKLRLDSTIFRSFILFFFFFFQRSILLHDVKRYPDAKLPRRIQVSSESSRFRLMRTGPG